MNDHRSIQESLGDKTSKAHIDAKYHCYSAYGSTIRSRIRCPELSPGFGTPDVTIDYDTLAAPILGGAKAKNGWPQAAPGRLLITWEGGRYLVLEGSSILVDPAPQVADEVVRLILLESAFPALLHQRGLLSLHGSTVKVGQGCIVFLGDSASGKSTIAAALKQRGYPVLADEISAVSLNNPDQPEVLPAYPQLNLWPDALEILGEERLAFRPVRSRLQKFALPLGDAFYDRPLPLRAIYVLRAINVDTFALEKFRGAEKMEQLIAHTHQWSFLKELGLLKNHFEMCAKVANLTPMKLACHPKATSALQKFIDLVEKDFSE